MLKENWGKIKTYLATQVKNAFREMVAEIRAWELTKMTHRKVLNIGLLLAGLGMGIFFQWGVMNTLIFLIFIGIILHPISSRIMVCPVIFFLILTPFALILEQAVLAEKIAVYAYYFLVMTVFMGIYELRREKRSE